MRFGGSRYSRTEVVTVAGTPTLATRRIPPTPAALTHLVLDGERLDHLAARFYGDPTKYWLILDANTDELNPFRLLRPARRIRIPRDQAVDE
jgi:nucleoid-associated protein YgaU